MKKQYLGIIGLALLTGACSSDSPVGPVPGPQDVTLYLGISDVIFVRGGSQQGGLDNMVGKNLTFTAVVATTEETPVAVYAESKTVTIEAGKMPDVNFTAQLVPGVEYQVIAYANFADSNAPTIPESATPEQYLEALGAISCSYSLNNEAQDSYSGTMTFTTSGNAVDLNLTRPCAKIRVVNTGTELPAGTTLSGELGNAFPLSNTFSATNATFASTELQSSTLASAALPSYTEEAEGEQTIAVLYVPVNGSEQSEVNLTLTINNGTTSVTKSITSVPVKRNSLTTIRGTFD